MAHSSGFDLADVIDEAISRSGGLDVTAESVTSARRSLYLILNEWNIRNFDTWRVETREFSFPVHDRVVPVHLDRFIDDVLQVNVVQYPNNPQARGSEVTMRRVDETQYAQLTAKATHGQPSQYVFSRTEPPSIRVFPLGRPDLGNELLRVTYVARPQSFSLDNQDLDSPSRWTNALVAGMALDMARKRPLLSGQGYPENTISRLAGEYEMALQHARLNDRQRVNFQVRLGRR